MSDVFISYARSTAKQAQTVADALRGLGYSVWIDDDLPAHRSYSRVIEDEMTAAKAAVVIWSADAVQSEWVLSEANRAREDRKLVQVTTDKARLPMPFDTIQCADLAGWTGNLDAPGWRKVIASIGDLVGGAAPPSPKGQADAPAAAKPPEPLLAVLAFDNLSGDADMAYFSDGVSEEILQTVVRGADLKVIGRGSSFQFRGADKGARHVALQPMAAYADRETLVNKGLAVAPNDLDTLAAAASFLLEVGRVREALGRYRQGRDIDPLSAAAAMACTWGLAFEDRYDESRDIWPAITARWPEPEYMWTTWILVATANADWASFDQIVESLDARGPLSRQLRGLVSFGRALREPDPDYVAHVLARAQRDLAATGWVELQVLTSLCALGARDETFELIDRASFAHMFDPEGPIPANLVNPGLIFDRSSNRAMMNDPRFLRLCAKMGLVDYWTQTDHWPDCAAEGVLPYDFKAEAKRRAA
ncbi:MAG TPA: TIR domain-containing protein [Caulobacteraceae bacterium]|nr:TIR domain-containing protein [Caulobacteraceae bacterium]